MEDTIVIFSPEKLPIKSGKTEIQTNFRTDSVDTPTDSEYKNVSNKTFQDSYTIEYPTEFKTYKND